MGKLMVASLLTFVFGGCVSASLATSTGPHPPQQRWSMAAKQMAHVGETVHFDFVLTDWLGQFVAPTGLADYCVVIPSRLRTGIGEERIEVEPDANGHFQFTYRLDHVGAGDKLKITATAFQQFDSRDFMKVGTQWLKADSPYAQPDRKVAVDAVQFTVYQTTLDLKPPRPADDLDPESGVLRFQNLHGGGPIYLDKPGRSGFRIVGPGTDGYYRVEYRPTGEQLNPTGTTDVEFTVYDLGGQRHVMTQTLNTP